MDLITNLPSIADLDSIMVMVDHGLSKGVILAPCTKTVNTMEIAKNFFFTMFSNGSDYMKKSY